jgi:hypothetical protein
MALAITRVGRRAVEAPMGQKRVDKRPIGVPPRRVNHKAGRLVDHDEVLVFVHDIEGDRGVRFRRRGRRRLGVDLDDCANPDLPRGTLGLPVDAHVTVLDPPGYYGPRLVHPSLCEQRDDQLVKPIPRIFDLGSERENGHGTR